MNRPNPFRMGLPPGLVMRMKTAVRFLVEPVPRLRVEPLFRGPGPLPGFLLGLGLILGCMQDGGGPGMQDGGGSDTETLTGILRTAEGEPAVGARVRLIPEGFDPSGTDTSGIRTSITDAEGRYRFQADDAFKSGAYNILALSRDSGQAAFQPGVAPKALPSTLTLAKARVYFVSLHGDAYASADSGKAWLPGTDLFVRCDGRTASKLGGVPRGIDDLVLESRAGWRHDYTVTLPGDSLVIRANRYEVQCQPF